MTKLYVLSLRPVNLKSRIMARAFRPSVSVNVPRNYSGEFDKHICNGSIQKSFGTYTEVKRRMRDLLNLSSDNDVSVYRHRRGEWGEWFEHWSMVNGRPEITRSGWM
jgi:hypothetical protein